MDVTESSGIGSGLGAGLGIVCADFSGDHWPDILVANDGKPNFLWINQQDGRFVDEGALRGLAVSGPGAIQANMGIAYGDVDGDDLEDVLITHLPLERHVCWKQGPRGYFQDRTYETGLGMSPLDVRMTTGFGTLFADFDHDGDLDAAIVNGAISRSPGLRELPPQDASPDVFWEPYMERNVVLGNDGQGQFYNFANNNQGFSTMGVWRGLAAGDLDNDGAIDLVATQIDGPAKIYRNVCPDRGHWLIIRAIDPALGGRDMYGAEVTIHAGERKWKRLVNPAYSYLVSNDPRVHFGLGTISEIDAIEVTWPDGTGETFPGGPVDQHLTLAKGAGSPGPLRVKPDPEPAN